MLSRILFLCSFSLLFCFASTVFGQSDFQEGLEKFFDSRTILGELDLSQDSQGLCSLCRTKIDHLAPRIIEVLKNEKIIRIEGFDSKRGDVKSSLKFAELVHRYLRTHHKIEAPLYLTGYSDTSGGSTYPKIEIVSYDGILPVEDAEIQTVIVR